MGIEVIIAGTTPQIIGIRFTADSKIDAKQHANNKKRFDGIIDCYNKVAGKAASVIKL